MGSAQRWRVALAALVLPARALAHAVLSPALIVVGSVVRLQPELAAGAAMGDISVR